MVAIAFDYYVGGAQYGLFVGAGSGLLAYASGQHGRALAIERSGRRRQGRATQSGARSRAEMQARRGKG